MEKNDRTKRFAALYRLMALFSLVCTIGPITVFTVYAIANGEIGSKQKLTLGLCLLVCVLLVIINTIKKYNLRSPVYIMILGVHTCIQNLTLLFIIMAVTTALDEFVFTPLKREFRTKYTINKEIDARG